MRHRGAGNNESMRDCGRASKRYYRRLCACERQQVVVGFRSYNHLPRAARRGVYAKFPAASNICLKGMDSRAWGNAPGSIVMIRCALKAHDSSRSRRVDTRNRALTEHRERPPSPWGAAPGSGIIAFQAILPETFRRPPAGPLLAAQRRKA